ncbi:unnamed protein product [Mytilus coruscus]|uniref:Integrase zinc-binding domain-containing protein n=1 Tax=Mytilus coruscus TaxID=42192 RepID=A0A6J8AC57_MYTCO|nr:unnamed protein product [Mytilus coruscus]
MEYLKCGPCAKCTKRALDMACSMKNSPNLEKVKNLQNLNSVKTRNQSEQENTWNVWKSGYTIMQLKHFQESDRDIGPILKWKTEGERPSWKELERYSPATRHYWHLWDSLQIKDGVLFKEFLKRDGSGHHFQFMTPSNMKDEVLSQMHNSITTGHLGQKKTKEKLAQRFFWFEMKEDISIWISKCDVCEAIKPPV